MHSYLNRFCLHFNLVKIFYVFYLFFYVFFFKFSGIQHDKIQLIVELKDKKILYYF